MPDLSSPDAEAELPPREGFLPPFPLWEVCSKIIEEVDTEMMLLGGTRTDEQINYGLGKEGVLVCIGDITSHRGETDERIRG